MTSEQNAIQYQRDLFALADEFFRITTGMSAEEFESGATFGETIHANADKFAKGFSEASRRLHDRFVQHYDTARSHFADPAGFGGMKLVLGGGSRFYKTQFDSVRKLALYADTILIPDPILPWLEEERDEERFGRVELLRTMMWLLRLKPLVDAELPHPAVLVFPSFERTLDRNDTATQRLEDEFVAQFFSYFCRRHFSSLDELVEFVRGAESEFISCVNAAKLFIPSGEESPTTVADGLPRHLVSLGESRTEDHMKLLESLPNGEAALYTILERLIPQFHLLENSEELKAQPMVCFESHWHYFSKVATVFEQRLIEARDLKPETAAVAHGISEPTLSWLGNVPVPALVELRRNGENEQFRRRIDAAMARLHESDLDDLDRVVVEISHELRSLVGEHQKDVRAMEDKYAQKHLASAVGSWTTLAAVLLPALAPFVGAAVAPIALGGKYLYDKVAEIGERRRASKSLIGVLAAARGTAV